MPQGQSQRGFTYILLLWWVAISGVLLAALGQQWLMESRRQKEAEFVFRGTEIGTALGRYQDVTPIGQLPGPLSMADLLEDKRGPKTLRHLRQLWLDPITGKPWVFEREQGRIVAVHSASKAKPIRPPDGVDAYDQWRFVPMASKAPAAAASSASQPVETLPAPAPMLNAQPAPAAPQMAPVKSTPVRTFK
jgi:type II secretory pathway pseudopilin PulG